MPEAETKWKHFSVGEMACSHCGKCEMDDAFMARLDGLREKVGFPLVVSSGFRCAEHNQAVSSTGPNGPHTTGKAADIAVRGDRAYFLLKVAVGMGFHGIGVSQKGDKRFLHIDDCEPPAHPRPNIWSY